MYAVVTHKIVPAYFKIDYLALFYINNIVYIISNYQELVNVQTLCIYPVSHIQSVKSAMFEAGAGKIGNYDCCSWQTLGQGQYKPLKNSQPFMGNLGTIETVEEYKVELVVADTLIKQVVTAMKQAHPYEEPAYDVWELTSIS